MPIAAPVLGGIIAAGASLLGNLFNSGSNRRTNQRQADYNTDLYAKQRADALADWERNNVYNSPAQQMQRFKEAGLNPNLIYGNMQNAQPIRSVDAKAPDFVAPRIDTSQIGDLVSNYYNIKQQDLAIKQQQKALEMANEQIRSQQMKNNYDSSFTYNTEVGNIRKQQLQENVDKTIEDWNLTRSMRSMNPLKADLLENQTKNLMNTIKLSNLDYEQRVMTNNIIRQSLEQAIKLQGNRYELEKLANEVSNTLKRRMSYKLGDVENIDITRDILQLFNLMK